MTKCVERELPAAARLHPGPSVLAVVAGALLASLPAPAMAAMPGFYTYPGGDPIYDPYPNYDPYLNPIGRPAPIRPARPTPKPQPDLKSGLKAEPAKDFGAMPKGPLQIVVSIADQHVTLYSNGVRVAQGPVSTGVPGRPTPTGVFSIIQKDRFHHSNLYSNAPMPYMERITWSGVALHEGPLPGYPASHGCIRMTHDFAARLWHVARLGVRVIVARNDIIPADFAHPSLFEPKLKPAEPPVLGADPEKHVESSALVYVAQATSNGPETGSDQTGGAAGKPPQVVAPGAPAPAADALRGTVDMGSRGGVAEPVTAKPVTAKPALADPPKPAPDAADPDKAVPVPVPGKARSADQPVKHTGAVAVFISRKEKKLYVREGFEPLFDVPIEIAHPEEPLGTHVFTALGLADDGAHMRWNVMTVAAGPPRQLISPKIGPKAPAVARAPEDHLPQTATQALDRIQIPQEAVDRIGEILSPGASLVISDQGLGPETGEGTDFIVLTR
ncbi:MAG TPA: L,D-transpeptidase [Xanthobacteraceae bacterium]|nr:L,D-transpeptidase [Xanthobacteraceae bacterium]